MPLPDRRRSIAVVAAVALALLTASCSRTTWPAGGAERAVVRIEAEACTGLHSLEATGVAVAPDQLVTVAHTFDRIRSFRVVDDEGQPIEAELVWLDADRDLALLRTSDERPEWLPLATAAEGDVTRLISAADPGGLQVKRAVVLDLTSVTLDGAGERAALQLQADIGNGDSGAPVINTDGEMVGMVFATTRNTERGWAIAAAEIEPILDQSDDVPLPDCGRDR
ncbi:MAG: serine protease [Actinomycetota bacterium]